ncbi:MAG TPA: SMP-30/gluconolactonase/LRE family protein [Flavisolibacter sp.]|nr:SMP-30/gluconolactonase/LRE family protein [Flavisolibacter sp.]
MNPSLTIYDEAIQQFLNIDFEIEILANDCQFTEGPVWNSEGFYLFSDITANTVYKLVPGQQKQVCIAASGTENPGDKDLKPDQVGSNALAYDSEGTLLVCRHGSHSVAKWDGQILQPFITQYNGKPLNSPNDIIVDKKGRIFFSDPPYGLKEGKLNPEGFQPAANVYCYDGGELKIICDKYQYPNGVCITPDGKELYICSNKPFEKFISVYDLETLQFKRILAEENSDGIKCDPHGNVYLCNKDGIIVLNSEGKRLALIQFPTVPANCCWGGAERKDLFITAREKVYLLRNLLR